MSISIEIDTQTLVKAFDKLTREEKIFLIESIERDLLSEWDEYENTPEVIKRVNEAMAAYDKGDVVDLEEII